MKSTSAPKRSVQDLKEIASKCVEQEFNTMGVSLPKNTAERLVELALKAYVISEKKKKD